MFTPRRYDAAPSPRAIGALVVLAGAVGAAAGLFGMWSVALLAPLYLAACVGWPRLGLIGLLAACALDRIAVGVGGPNVRPDELAAIALAVALALRLWWQRAAMPRIPLLLPMLVYWAVNVASTVAAGGDIARGLSLDLITLDLVLLYAALYVALTARGSALAGAKIWLAVAGIEAIVGLLAFALYEARHGATPGIQFDPVSGAPMVYGTLYEANIFGSYMSAAFILALALATDETIRRKWPLYAVCALTALGLLLSATRSAWGSTALCVLLLLVLLQVGRSGKRAARTLRLAGGLLVAGVIVGGGLALAPTSITGALGARAQSLLNFGSGSGYGRVLLYTEAINEWKAHPLLGLGPGSFSYRLPGDTSPGPAWLPNLTLQALHDTGVVGLAAMIWLFAAFYVVTLRALRRAPPGQGRTALAGLIAAVSALLIAFQLTPGFLLGYSWAMLALATAAARPLAGATTMGAANGFAGSRHLAVGLPASRPARTAASDETAPA